VAKLDGSFVPKNRKSIHSNVGKLTIKKKKSSINETTLLESNTYTKSKECDRVSGACYPRSMSTDNESTVESIPSNIIFAQSLPKDCNEMMLAMLFRQYPGYREVRIPRPSLAFIEFDDEPHASVALKALNGFKLTANDCLELNYGKA